VYELKFITPSRAAEGVVGTSKKPFPELLKSIADLLPSLEHLRRLKEL
jgi:hypothetical protein